MNSGLGRAGAALDSDANRPASRADFGAILPAFAAIAIATGKEIYRSAAPLVFAIIGVVVALVANLMADAIDPENRAQLLLEIVFATVALASYVALVVITSTITPRDLEERSALTVLSKPVPRWTFILGRGGGVMVATMVLGLISFATSYVTLRLVTTDALGDTRVANPTRLVRAAGPTPEGRLVHLSEFPAEVRWLAADPSGKNDSLVRFRFEGKDIKKCLDHHGSLRLEMAALNAVTVPMNEVTPARVSLRSPDLEEPPAITEEVVFREQTAEFSLTPTSVSGLDLDRSVVVEVRPAGARRFLEADGGRASLSIPGAAGLTTNFGMASLGIVLAFAVLSWITFVGSILFSAKVAMLIGVAYAAFGLARENILALLHMLGSPVESAIQGGVFSPLEALERASSLGEQTSGWGRAAGVALEGLLRVIPELGRFNLVGTVRDGFCVPTSDLMSGARYAAGCIAVCAVISVVLVRYRRLR